MCEIVGIPPGGNRSNQAGLSQSQVWVYTCNIYILSLAVANVEGRDRSGSCGEHRPGASFSIHPQTDSVMSLSLSAFLGMQEEVMWSKVSLSVCFGF